MAEQSKTRNKVSVATQKVLKKVFRFWVALSRQFDELHDGVAAVRLTTTQWGVGITTHLEAVTCHQPGRGKTHIQIPTQEVGHRSDPDIQMYFPEIWIIMEKKKTIFWMWKRCFRYDPGIPPLQLSWSYYVLPRTEKILATWIYLVPHYFRVWHIGITISRYEYRPI